VSGYPDHLVSRDAEMGVLGSALLSRFAAREICRKLEPEMFYRPSSRKVFVGIRKLVGSGRPVDFLTLKSQLIEDGSLDEIGGEEYILQLAEFVPSPANSGHYAAIVGQLAAMRKVFRLGHEIGRNPELAGSDSMARELTNLARSLQASKELSPLTMREIRHDSEPGDWVESGIDLIDCTPPAPGWRSGQLSLIGAPTGGGKSQLAVKSLLKAAENGLRATYITLADIDASDIKRRMIRMKSGLFSREEEPEIWDDAVSAIERLNVEILDYTTQSQFAAAERVISEIETRHSVEPFDIVFIDYVGLLTSADSRQGKSFQASEQACNALVAAARTLAIPIIGCTQISRNEEKEIMPMGGRHWMMAANKFLVVRKCQTKAQLATVPDHLRGIDGLALGGIMKSRDEPEWPWKWMKWNKRWMRYDVLEEAEK